MSKLGPWVATCRAHHMLLCSSLNREAAWQQGGPLDDALAARLLGLVPPPQLPESQKGRRSGHLSDWHPLPHMNQGSPGHTTGLARQEMINKCLLSTSRQQRAAPSPSSPHPAGLCTHHSFAKQLSS